MTAAQGHIEYHYAAILASVRKIKEMFPDGQAAEQQFYASKTKLLGLFHKMGIHAKKISETEYKSVEEEKPHELFKDFAPDKLDRAKFSFGYFRRCLEEPAFGVYQMKTLSKLAGEEHTKYQNVKEERERKRRALLDGHDGVKQKCWFTLAALATALIAVSAVLAGLEAWKFYLLFIPPLVGAIPIGWVVFIPLPRPVAAEEVKTAWERCSYDVLRGAIRDIDNEIEHLEEKQKLWEGNWKLGRRTLMTGLGISVAIMLPFFAICC